MGPFRAKIGRKRMRKEENKNYRFVPFLPGAERKCKKKRKKIKKNHYGVILKKQQKNKKIPLWLNFNSKWVERG